MRWRILRTLTSFAQLTFVSSPFQKAKYQRLARLKTNLRTLACNIVVIVMSDPVAVACGTDSKDATLSASPLHNGDTGDWREAIKQALEGLA